MREGASAERSARALVSELTPAERLWLLDGDERFWPGVLDWARYGYITVPVVAGAVPRLGIPGFHFTDGPRGVTLGRSTCFPVTMARGASWDPALEEQVGLALGREARSARREPLRRRVHQPPAPPRLGTRAGNLRRGSHSPRRDGGGSHPGSPAPRDGVREALRAQQHRERAFPRRREGRRRRAARGLSGALPPRRRRGRAFCDERLQRGQRAVVWRQSRGS